MLLNILNASPCSKSCITKLLLKLGLICTWGSFLELHDVYTTQCTMLLPLTECQWVAATWYTVKTYFIYLSCMCVVYTSWSSRNASKQIFWRPWNQIVEKLLFFFFLHGTPPSKGYIQKYYAQTYYVHYTHIGATHISFKSSILSVNNAHVSTPVSRIWCVHGLYVHVYTTRSMEAMSEESERIKSLFMHCSLCS